MGFGWIEVGCDVFDRKKNVAIVGREEGRSGFEGDGVGKEGNLRV